MTLVKPVPQSLSKVSALVAALALAACSSTTPAPVINSFAATPVTVSPGQSSHLTWDVTGATTISIDQGVGVVSGTSADVVPASTTKYTLTATGLGGTTQASVTVTVGAGADAPKITSFTASPDSVAVNTQTTLSWAVTNATALSIDQGVGVVTGQTSKTVTVAQATTYTLTATGAGGSATRSVTVTTRAPVLHLQYTDPTSSTAKLLLVRNAASTNDHLILDLKVGAAAVTAFGVAINLPFDPASAGMITFTNSSASSTGGILPGVINFAGSPPTAAARLGGPAIGANTFTVGVAKHKNSVADGDDVWAAGATLFSLVFDMPASAAVGTNVFQSATLGAQGSLFRAAALHKDGTEAAARSDIAIGDLVISL